MTSETHGHLRAATRAAHQRLETRVDILGRAAFPEGRRELVAGFHRLHWDIETAVAPWIADLPGLAFDERRRTARLERDLKDLGCSAQVPTAQGLRAASVPGALGLLYLAEGSTLGGQVIRREAAARGMDFVGLSFLDPYGSQVGARWRDFLAVVDAAVRTPADLAAVVAGAVAGFRHAELRLCGVMAHD